MDGAILADVDALHRAHIGIEEESLDAAVGIPGGAFSPHVRDTHKAFEIGDLRGVHSRPKPVRWNVTLLMVAAFVVGFGRAVRMRCRRSGGRPEQPAAQRGPGSRGRRAADKGAT